MPPLASIALSTFNQERYVAVALRGAFAQTYRPLEIVVSDDCSTDGTWHIVEALAAECPPDISLRLRRNPINLGAAGNAAAAVAACGADVIFSFADDDVSEPGRVAGAMPAFDDPIVMAVCVGELLIDADGAPLAEQPPLERPMPTAAWLARSGHAGGNGASAAYRRALFNVFPPMAERLVQEDVVLFFRAALLGRIALLPQRLVQYRLHAASSSGRSGHRAESAEAYARASKRYVESIVRVRRQQLADLAHLAHTRTIADADILARDLTRLLRQETMCRDLIDRRLAAIPQVVRHMGRMKRVELLKAVAMHLAPRLWYRWINRAR